MKKGDNKLHICFSLTLFVSFIWATGAVAEDWSWTNLPPDTRVVVGNNNPQKDTVATAYDSNGNVIREELINRAEPAGEQPDFTAIKEPEIIELDRRDDDLQRKVDAACSHGCDIYMSERDISVETNDSGKRRKIWCSDNGEVRCVSGCESETPPPSGDDSGPGEGGSGSGSGGSGSGSGGSGAGDGRGNSSAGGGGGPGGGDRPEDEGDLGGDDMQCYPGIGLQCWEEGERICRCGGEDKDGLGGYKQCQPKFSCINMSDNSSMTVVSCDDEPPADTAYWIELRISHYVCLKPFVAPRNASPLDQAREGCGELIDDRCEGGGGPYKQCRNLVCPVGSEYHERVEYFNGARNSSFFCHKCRNPIQY